ncbi:FecR domain-containing protein [Candidatus Pelagibacter sp.]|nr:FecR domain-containing protein [Candidatus Pelagibacter sp.]
MNNINTSFKKIYFLLILVFSFFLISVNTAHTEEKIGSIVTIKNEVFAINAKGKKRLLDLYDEILLQDEILTNELSTVTVQYNDSSTIIIKELSSFKVTDFNITGLKDIFIGVVEKGSVIIESGKIAKKNDGSMTIVLPTMTLNVKGTRFNIENNPDGTSEVSLAEDSFGNVGTISISSEGEVKTLFDTDQVISVNTETGISERPKTDDEKQELVNVSNDLIKASSIDENVIQKNLEEKLLNGSLLDANGDGIIDESDISVIKEGIKLEKQEKLDFIVDNSTGENTEFLSQVLNQSDETSIGQSMDKIFESNNYLLSSVITNLVSEDNTFLTTSNSEANNAIKEKIYTQMLNDVDGNNNNIGLIGNIISKSDGATVERMINFVEISDANNEDANLSLQVLSSVADATSFYNVDFDNEGQAQIDRLMEDAVYSAAKSEDGAIYLANIMSKGSEESIYMMMDTIGQVGETFTDSTLALEVLSSMAENDSFDDMNFGDQGQAQFDNMMEDAVYSAAKSEDGAMMLGNVMTNSDTDTMGTMLSYISDVAAKDPNSTFAAEVLSEIVTITANTDTYYDTETMNQFSDLVDTVAYTDAATDDAATLATTTTTDDAAALAATTTTTDDMLYDVAGFAFAPPYYHKDTETMYNNAGFDKDGNSSASGSGDSDVTYDAAGFSMDPPYHHKDTDTMYNKNGFDKDGNSSGGSVAWTTTSASFPTTLTKGTGITSISLSASGVGTISYTYSGTLPSGIDLSGDTVSGNPNTVQAATSVTITATDEDNNTSDLFVNFPAVTAGGSVAWTTTQGDFPSTLTKGTGITSISLSASGVGTISYTYSGTLPSGIDLSGDTVSGNPNTVQAATSVTITATDEDNNTNNLAVNFPAVTAGGSFDANGFSTITPFDHNVTGTQFDSEGLHRTTRTSRDDGGYNAAGYNVNGFNRASQWSESYDEIDNVSSS